jgi:chromosome segregation protein
VQTQNTRKARLRALGDERVNLQNRTIRAKERIKQLTARQETLSAKLEELKVQPKNFDADKEKLLSKITESETARDEAAEKLASCEAEVAETTKALKEAERILSEAREARAHAQATLSVIVEQIEGQEAAIVEKFDMKPQDLPQHSAIDMDRELGDLESLRSKKEKLARERDAIGPVNLRADEEAQELEKEVGGLLHERNDLMEAIAELRQAINKINAEARERLLAAFDHVNAHFQRLFTQLFRGGKAHLALIDDEETQAKDPLGAGLEIFAQPPGKALQSLSLLSGGEQTLASIALIFAMFLTNPSPVCVLDEIDAPLDDANVDRVCDLLEEIAERGETRFLIVTHHRLTMARMNRLYGVTMSEKGVSQLVSVDLQQSFSFLDEAA